MMMMITPQCEEIPSAGKTGVLTEILVRPSERSLRNGPFNPWETVLVSVESLRGGRDALENCSFSECSVTRNQCAPQVILEGPLFFFFCFGPSESVPHFVINEAVLTRLEVCVQPVLHIDYFLVLRRTLAVVLAAARTGFLRVRVLKYLSDVHLLSERK